MVNHSAYAQSQFDKEIDYQDLTSAEQTAARQAAREKQFEELVFCADPGNMPLSNNKAEGYQNKIAKAIGAEMNANVRFFWRPFLERGLTRETFDNRECEIIIEVPKGYERILTSMPIYRSTYVFATRKDADFEIENFDDPDLRDKSVGVFQHSAMREALSRHGIKEGLDLHILSYDADLKPEKQPWNQVQRVADGTLDIAGVWGPFAGWVEAQGEEIQLTPANLMEDEVVLEFDLAYGLRTNDVVLKYALDFAMINIADEIEAILREYGVPLVECSDCAVSGDLPAHGSYFENIIVDAQERFTTQKDQQRSALDESLASPDQIMTIEKVEQALANGADVQSEFADAVLASDEARMLYLLEKGADINRADLLGATPLVTAAKNRDTSMLALLLENGADPNQANKSGYTALHHAILRNHVPSVSVLLENGADPLIETENGHLPALPFAIEMDMNWASQALIDFGVPPDQRFGEFELTPLMLIATRTETRDRAKRVTGGPSLVELGEALIANGADVNATTTKGVTALMIAAGNDNNDILALLLNSGADVDRVNDDGNNALDIAILERSHDAEKALGFLVNQ